MLDKGFRVDKLGGVSHFSRWSVPLFSVECPTFKLPSSVECPTFLGGVSR
jgi:hypothetical protein